MIPYQVGFIAENAQCHITSISLDLEVLKCKQYSFRLDSDNITIISF